MKKLATAGLQKKFQKARAIGRQYRVLFFIVALAAVYGFVVYRINVLSQSSPNPNDVSLQLQATRTPKVDPNVISKIQQLQDNSVNVQALFDQARNNPFNE
jgi:zona occludens toxin (predicted ATPase)